MTLPCDPAVPRATKNPLKTALISFFIKSAAIPATNDRSSPPSSAYGVSVAAERPLICAKTG